MRTVPRPPPGADDKYRRHRGIGVSGVYRQEHGFWQLDGTWNTRLEPLEELQTIGIARQGVPRFVNSFMRINIVPSGVSENALRREQGLTRRLSFWRVENTCE